MYAIDSQTYPQKMWKSRAFARRRLFALVAGLALSAPVFSGESAGSYLNIAPQHDGKCQNLSEGGKLVVLRNTHPARSIRFRLVRYFKGVPQSRIVGAVAPGEEGQKLGCNRVDGRDQSWKIERAEFEQGD